MYKVIGGVKSRTLRVLWMLEELGEAYDHIDAAPRSEEALAHHPQGKIPALVVDGTTLTDSVAIMTYLADKHGKFTYEAGSLERAKQDALTQFIAEEFDNILWTAARHSFVLPEDKRVPEVKESLRWEFERSQTSLVDRMDENGPFLMGDMMTLPDLLLAHCAGWAIGAKFPITQARVKTHMEMMRARPAFKRALQG